MQIGLNSLKERNESINNFRKIYILKILKIAKFKRKAELKQTRQLTLTPLTSDRVKIKKAL